MASTRIIAPGRPAFTVPGQLTQEQVLAAFGPDLGLADMNVSRTTQYDDATDEDIVVYAFSHKTGGKG